MLSKIISGGQTGADQAGLKAARACLIETGGWAPKGYRTEDGENPLLGTQYGLKESTSPKYPPRTRLNIANSDGTLVFANVLDGGSALTVNICKELDKPVLHIMPISEFTTNVLDIMSFIKKNNIKILNIAGNRYSRDPYIFDEVFRLLVDVFERLENAECLKDQK